MHGPHRQLSRARCPLALHAALYDMLLPPSWAAYLQRRPTAVPIAAVNATLGALCLWQSARKTKSS